MVSAASFALRTAASLGLSLVCVLSAPLAKASCDDLLPNVGEKATASRLVTGRDLLRVREIGQPDASLLTQDSPLAISPDGRRLALLLNRADPDSNNYCRALLVLDLDRSAEARALDRGGDLITMTAMERGLLQHSGYPALVTPVWSPDGHWIAYLRRDHGVTQLWRVRTDGASGPGAAAQAVTHSPVDVERFAWSRDGRYLIYGATPAVLDAEKAIDRESKTGWLNDGRMFPPLSARPMVSGPLPQQVFVIDPETRAVAPAGPADQRYFTVGQDSDPTPRSTDGRRAWAEHVTGNPLSPRRLHIEDRDGKRIACTGADCTGYIYKLWWAADGRSLIVLRREGWNKGQMGLLRWTPGTSAFHRILLTDDVLTGCLPRGDALICNSENAVTPRQVVEISLKDGRRRLIYDANPEFRTLRLGKVTRLTWTNDLGFPTWGDLALPPDYKPGTKLPMVVVQYHSDGFLRGGTGDEYPIHALAARGFAVLSFERPPFFGSDNPDLHNIEEIVAAGVKDWNERRNILSALVTGVKTVLARGEVDPARIGISGLSDGASTTRFALVNTRLFAAAAISTCCADTNTVMHTAGIAFADEERALGYPLSIEHDDAFWAPYSMSLSAKRMDRPLLMQLADQEMQLALSTFMSLREAGQPVEMYVYPDEFHSKWQPVHRQAVYERNLDWFSFWLQDTVDPDPAKAAQYARWNAMKAKRRDIALKAAG